MVDTTKTPTTNVPLNTSTATNVPPLSSGRDNAATPGVRPYDTGTGQRETVNVAADHPNNRRMQTREGEDEPGTAPAPAPASIGGTDNAAETAHIGRDGGHVEPGASYPGPAPTAPTKSAPNQQATASTAPPAK